MWYVFYEGGIWVYVLVLIQHEGALSVAQWRQLVDVGLDVGVASCGSLKAVGVGARFVVVPQLAPRAGLAVAVVFGKLLPVLGLVEEDGVRGRRGTRLLTLNVQEHGPQLFDPGVDRNDGSRVRDDKGGSRSGDGWARRNGSGACVCA